MGYRMFVMDIFECDKCGKLKRAIHDKHNCMLHPLKWKTVGRKIYCKKCYKKIYKRKDQS